jgi:hypothetical protein
MLATEVPGVGDAPQGAADTEMAGAGISGDNTLGDAALAPGSLGTMNPGSPGQYLSGSPSSASPSINWRKHQACFEELTLLQTQGSKLCHAIVGPPQAKHLSEGMWLAALRYTEIFRELIAF